MREPKGKPGPQLNDFFRAKAIYAPKFLAALMNGDNTGSQQPQPLYKSSSTGLSLALDMVSRGIEGIICAQFLPNFLRDLQIEVRGLNGAMVESKIKVLLVELEIQYVRTILFDNC